MRLDIEKRHISNKTTIESFIANSDEALLFVRILKNPVVWLQIQLARYTFRWLHL